MAFVNRKIPLQAMKFLDLLIMTFAFLVAALAAHDKIDAESLAQIPALRVTIQDVAVFAALLFVWHLLFSLLGLYRSKRLSGPYHELPDILKATGLGALIVGLTGILLGIERITPAFGTIFWAASFGTAGLARWLLWYGRKAIQGLGYHRRHILIVGTNPRAIQFAQRIQEKPELGYRLVGFVDNEWAGISKFYRSGYKRVADFLGFAAFIRDQVVDEVLISLPVKSCYAQASQIISLCEEQGIVVRFLSDLFDLKLARSKAERLNGHTVISVYTGAMEGGPLLVKRLLDFLISTTLIALLSPLFLAVSLFIKVTSAGPVFFIQERVGLNKRRFRMYKFRTMFSDAEERLVELEHLNEMTGPVFKIKNDPRLTSIGKFLRRTSIDELPQLFNVLKGDLSLVGPRPLPVRDYQGFDQDWHRRRVSVRPGITCLWQVNGRTNTPFDKWMKLDMEYIDRWSLALDLKILLKTIPAVLKGSGAT